ncbi:MAG: tRNA pseudouridine(55) synthase TruB [Candidatus Babeliales bacterium]
MTHNNLSGFLCINKPAGVRSYRIINYLKQFFPKGYKIGHAGTLDSFASGLMVIGFGKEATKRLSLLLSADKVYHAVGKAGVTTHTLDPLGSIIRQSTAFTTKSRVIQVLQKLQPCYIQTPPFYSALKHKGQRLSDVAQKTCPLLQTDTQALVEKKQRQVFIYSLKLLQINLPYITLSTHVSHGTYIRSLMRDIGSLLSMEMTTVQLTRIRVGPFTLAHALLPDLSWQTIQQKHCPILTFDKMMNSYSIHHYK